MGTIRKKHALFFSRHQNDRLSLMFLCKLNIMTKLICRYGAQRNSGQLERLVEQQSHYDSHFSMLSSSAATCAQTCWK